MKKLFSSLLIIFCLVFQFSNLQAQNNVGIGTLNPNTKALLDLTANDKGILVPRVTSAQRIAINPTGNTDAALLVYDTDDSLFYFWNSAQWVAFPQQGGSNNIALNFDANTGVLSLTDNGGTLTTIIPPDNDSNPNNELITNVVFNANGNILTINEGGNIWSTTISIVDPDSDPANEYNTALSFNSNTNILSVTDAGGSINTDLSSLSNNWKLLGNAGTNPATNFLGTTDNQDLVLRTNNTERVRVTNVGNVGIGTTTPANRLHILSGSYDPFVNASSSVFVEGSYGGGILMRDCNFKFGGMYLINCGADMRFNMKSSAGTNIDVMNLNEGGNVGIGTTLPAYRLDVAGSGRFGGGSNSSVYLAGGATAGAGGFEIFGLNNVGYIRFHDPNVAWRDIAINDAGGKVGVGTISPVSKLTVQTTTENDGIYLTNGSRRIHMIPGNVVNANWNSMVQNGDNLILFSENAENTGNLVIAPWVSANVSRGIRIIGSNGRVGIGTASPDHLLSVNGDAGKPGGGSWATFSDKRVKKDINSFNDGLNVVMSLKPVTFKYNEKSGYSNLDKSYVGFIAQEVEQVAPYMVELYNDTEGPSGLADKRQFDESALTKILVNAIQEQQQQIEALKTKNAHLENKTVEIESLKAKLEKLESYIYSETKK